MRVARVRGSPASARSFTSVHLTNGYRKTRTSAGEKRVTGPEETTVSSPVSQTLSPFPSCHFLALKPIGQKDELRDE